jgi:hypothetical protein
MMQNGQVFEQQTQVRLTTDSESSLSPIETKSMLRSPKASEGQGGALGEAEALRRGNTVGVRDQIMDLVAGQGLQVSRQVDNLMPTPTTMDAKATNDLEVTQKFLGQGRQTCLTYEMTLLPTVKARDAQAEGYEAGLRRSQPQVGTIVKGLVDGDERVLMPTPNTMEHLPARTGEARERQLYRGGSDSRRSSSGNLREDILDLMPTPKALDGFKGNLKTSQERLDSGNFVDLPNIAIDLMPTPQVDDSKNTGHNQDRRPTLASEVWETQRKINWGKFEPAIRRWEQVLGRPAPAPTKPDGKDDAHRLSSKFTEWMMGLPDGWITDCGLSRNEELKAAGNGVVPQQAELALRILLEGIEFTPGGGK